MKYLWINLVKYVPGLLWKPQNIAEEKYISKWNDEYNYNMVTGQKTQY